MENSESKAQETDSESSGTAKKNNAKPDSTKFETLYNPHPREVMGFVVSLWTQDKDNENLSYGKLLNRIKSDNANWSLSEKRLKQICKDFNLRPNQPPFTYVKETKSSISETAVELLPETVKLQMTKSRGKGIFATHKLKAGQELWVEPPLVQTPAPELLRIMRSGNACAYCGQTLRTAEGQLIGRGSGVSCTATVAGLQPCSANWCNNDCKRADLTHAELWHDLLRNKFSVSTWRAYEEFCIANNWRAGSLYGITLISKLKGDPKRPTLANDIDDLATVSQATRQKAVSDPSSLDYEQLEEMWKRGWQLLSRTVRNVYQLSYEEYLEGVGMVNINNLDGAIFLLHSNLNHCCTPNVSVDLLSRTKGIRVVAKEDIEAGKELLTSYVDPEASLEERQYALRVNYGFICGCTRCKEEKTKPEKEETPVVETRKRSKSVRFDKNPVTQTVEVPTKS